MDCNVNSDKDLHLTAGLEKKFFGVGCRAGGRRYNVFTTLTQATSVTRTGSVEQWRKKYFRHFLFGR